MGGSGSLGEGIGGQRFAEPHHVGAEGSAAVGTGWRNFRGIFPGFYNYFLTRALGAVDIAVEVDGILAAGAGVEVVDVLGDEGEVGGVLFEVGQGVVGGVGVGAGDEFAAPDVPLPDQAGVAGEGFWGGEVFGAVAGPQAGLGVAEGGDATCGGDAGAGEGGDVAGPAELGD